MGIIIIVYSCTFDSNSSNPLELNLRWVKSYPDEKIEDVVKGLKWYFFFLGAELREGSLENSVTWDNDSTFAFDFSAIGFDVPAQRAFAEIIKVLKESDEYKVHHAIDLGRLIALTLNSSYHYYAITNAESSFKEFQDKFDFESKLFSINSSSVAKGNRLLHIAKAKAFSEIAFIAEEGEGSIADSTFVRREYEIITVMPNGQFRFALYDLDGRLKSTASSELTQAGKPAKCMWCHESSLQPLYQKNEAVTGYLTPEEFMSSITAFSLLVNNYRSTLDSEIDFSTLQDHTKMELLYIGFLQPSSYRLVREWNLPLKEIEKRLQHIPVHPHEEFSFFGDQLRHRKDIDQLGPYSSVKVPEDAREPSDYEPDFMHP